jgi:hypothetical protein
MMYGRTYISVEVLSSITLRTVLIPRRSKAWVAIVNFLSRILGSEQWNVLSFLVQRLGSKAVRYGYP